MCYSCIIFFSVLYYDYRTLSIVCYSVSYQSIINLIVYTRRTCYSSILSSLLTRVLHAERIALSIIKQWNEQWNNQWYETQEYVICIKQMIGLKSNLLVWSNRLDKRAIDWKQSLGLPRNRLEAIAWLVTKRLEAHHLHWNRQWRAEHTQTHILPFLLILSI